MCVTVYKIKIDSKYYVLKKDKFKILESEIKNLKKLLKVIKKY